MSDTPLSGKRRFSKSVLLFSAFLLVPIYWLVVLSLQPNLVSETSANIIPNSITLENYRYIFSQKNWVDGYVNTAIFVAINVLITVSISLPAAYAFSRFLFIGREHAFFFVFIFRLVPPAIMIIPFVQMFSAVNMIDTHFAVALAHGVFTIPISIWILEGFISAIPKEMEEAAFVDGYSRFSFFIKILLPQIKTGIGVAIFFSFMFSWVELTIANALTTVDAKPIGVVMRIVASPLGQVHIGISSAASVLMIVPGLILVWLLRKHLARGFSMGRVG
ncbi:MULTISPECIES: carbohydrate ABC transporter permease [unclassified Lentilitoribacter]|jgi:glycerol transport system permease protein|uniref:carbohydrate ABC transporter permease n=1 Tax=unclassified Lentilitoribacter TaxID=2647570 RepID=UPI0013A69A8A|nr:carbohydrate ABC transporter permease [Lentilitoribacter sp. Alg239-R112]